MKKLFFFAAAMIAAVTVNAGGTVDYTGMVSESEYTIANTTLNSASTETQKIYDMSAVGADCTWYKNGADFAEFHITNTSEAKKKIFTVNLNKSDATNKDAACPEFGGKNGTIYLKGLQAGDVIKMVVACKSAYDPTKEPSKQSEGKISIVAADKSTVIGEILTLPYKDKEMAGIDPDYDSNGYCWKTFEVTVTSEMFSTTDNLVYVKDKGAGFRVKSIQAGASTAIFDVESGAKAVKKMIDGQIVIEKGGKLYNALGAEL
jgi:hypothetical protein